MSEIEPRAFEFGPYRLDLEERLLRRGAEIIRLTPKAFDTLALLVTRAGHLCSKNELIERLWPDAHVEENNLAQYVSVLRRALDDGQGEAAYIETVPRTGYRFVAAVRPLNGTGGEARGQTAPALAAPEASPEPEPRVPEAPARPSWIRRHVIAVGASATILAVAGYAMSGPARSLLSSPPVVRTLVVLPFATDSPEETPDIPLAVAAGIIDRLEGSWPGHALPKTSLYRFVRPPRKPAGTHDLPAEAALSGRLRPIDSARTEVSTTLAIVATGRAVWSDTFVVPTGRLDEATARISSRVAAALNWTLPDAEAAPSTVPSFEARRAYEMGRYFWNTRSAEGVFRSIALLERAVSLAPGEARVHAALGDAYAFDLATWPQAQREARRALELDGRLGQAHATLAFLHLFWERTRDAADGEFRQALELSPDYATAHQWHALLLAARGELGGARAEIDEARRLDPYSAAIETDQCHVLYLARDYDRAAAVCRQVLHDDPDFLNAHLSLLAIAEQTGSASLALDEYSRICAIRGEAPPCHIRQPLNEIRAQFDRDGLSAFWRWEVAALERQGPAVRSADREARDYARLGDKDGALAALDRLATSDDLESLFVGTDPAFDTLRGDPRFNAIVDRIYTPRHAPASSR